MSALPPRVLRLEHFGSFQAQRSSRAALHALAACQAVRIGNWEPLPGVAPHVDPEGAVERADPAFDAARRLGNHMRRDQGAASLYILVEQAAENARRQPGGPLS